MTTNELQTVGTDFRDAFDALKNVFNDLADALNEIAKAIYSAVYSEEQICRDRFRQNKIVKKFFFWEKPFKKIRPTARSSI